MKSLMCSPTRLTPLFAALFTLNAVTADWPAPEAVDPGAPGGIPADAIVLFDGKDLSQWRNARGGPAQWKLVKGAVEVNGTGNVFTKEGFGDCQLHVEWASPKEASGESQGRGNSGVYFQGRYEIQVLDSYRSQTYPAGQAGAFYNHFPPLVNACRPPGEWQSYDIVFRKPTLADDGKTIVPGSLTAFHNGVLIQDNVPVTTPTVAAAFEGTADKAPIMLQDHGNPVRYRLLWIRPLAPRRAAK